MLRAALLSGMMFTASICHADDLTVAKFNTESDDDTQPTDCGCVSRLSHQPAGNNGVGEGFGPDYRSRF